MEQKVVIASNKAGLNSASINAGCSHVAPLYCCWERTVPIDWASVINGETKHKLARNVLHKGEPIAKYLHDCGRMIQHASPFGADWSLGNAMSGRKIRFNAHAVLIDGDSVGFGLFAPPGEMSTPMLTCGLLPAPIGDAFESVSNSVIVGMDPDLDYDTCWTGIAISSAFSAFNVAAGVVTLDAPKSVLDVVTDIAKDLGLGLLDDVPGATEDPGERYVENVQSRGQRPAKAASEAVARGLLPWLRPAQDFGSEMDGD